MIKKLAPVMPDSIYLATVRTIVTTLSKASFNNQWQRWTKRELGLKRSPMWATELYQLTTLLGGLVLLFSLPEPSRAPRIVTTFTGVLAVFRLFEILLFALHWVLVDRRPVKEFRRSLVWFGLSLLELGVFATLALFWFTGGFSGTRWALLYEMLGAVFNQSVPTIVGTGGRILVHAVVIESWIVLLIVIAVAVSGITRRELTRDGTARR